MKKYYLAYGSNLNMDQMFFRCPTAKPVGTGVIEDYRLMFKGSKTGAYLTIEQDPGQKVPVGVWEVDRDAEKALDCYEGYPRFYYKKYMNIMVKDINTGQIRQRRCFVYIMHEDREFGMPSRSYVDTCVQGYDDFGFEAGYLLDAIRFTKRNAA